MHRTRECEDYETHSTCFMCKVDWEEVHVAEVQRG